MVAVQIVILRCPRCEIECRESAVKKNVLDWLREPTDEGYPHWEHTSRADEASYLAEHGESSEGGNYTSDKDE